MAVTLESRWRDLMCRSQAGDAKAHRCLLTELAPYLRRYFNRRLSDSHACEDLVQDTLISIHNRRDSYDPGQPLLRWIHAISNYRLIDRYRQAARWPTLPVDDDLACDQNDHAATEARMTLDAGLASLSARDASIVRLAKIEGHSSREVAAQTGLNESAVKVALHRSLKRLTQILDPGP